MIIDKMDYDMLDARQEERLILGVQPSLMFNKLALQIKDTYQPNILEHLKKVRPGKSNDVITQGEHVALHWLLTNLPEATGEPHAELVRVLSLVEIDEDEAEEFLEVYVDFDHYDELLAVIQDTSLTKMKVKQVMPLLEVFGERYLIRQETSLTNI